MLGPISASGYSLLSDYYGDQVCYGNNFDCITTIFQVRSPPFVVQIIHLCLPFLEDGEGAVVYRFDQHLKLAPLLNI